MSSGANDQAKVLQFVNFRDHGLGHIAVYPTWRHVLIAKLFQPSHNAGIPTAKGLSEIFWRTITDLAYDLHQLTPHTPLQRFAWWIAGAVL